MLQTPDKEATEQMNPTPALVLASLALTACAPRGPAPSYFVEPAQVAVYREGPEDAAEGTCWGKDQTPATIETTTEQFLVTPAEADADGKITKPATYRTVTNQRIVESREVVWFETACPEDFTEDFIASLQRSLQLRGFFAGEISGIMTPETGLAIRNFQKPQGLNSATLSIVAARKLGLVAYSRSDIDKF